MELSATAPMAPVTLKVGTVLGRIAYENDKGRAYTDFNFAMSDGTFVSAKSFDAAIATARELSAGDGKAQGVVDVGRGAYLVIGLYGLTADPNSRTIAYPMNHSLSGFRTGLIFKNNWQATSAAAAHDALKAIVDGDKWADLRSGGSQKPVALPTA